MSRLIELVFPERTVDRTVAELEARLTPPFRERLLGLPDQRRLALAEFGDPDGDVVLWFHGTPGARRQLPPDAAKLAEELGVRIIGIDRPGVGDSTPHPERTLLTWAHDVRAVLDHLQVDRVGVCGLSGGGPHVLSVAHLLKERVQGAALLGSVAPLVGEDRAPALPTFLPSAMRMLHAYRSPIGDAVTRVLRAVPGSAADQAFPMIMRLVPKEDREVLDTPRMRAMFIVDIFHGSRASFRAQIQDMAVFGRAWGFSVREVEVQTRLWHGTSDQMVPFAHAEHLARIMPAAELLTFEGEGHFAGFIRPREVLQWLKDRLHGEPKAVSGVSSLDRSGE